MTDPGGRLPGGSVRVITLGARGKIALAVALLLAGGAAVVIGTTLLIVLAVVGIVAGVLGAIGLGVRTLLRGRAGRDRVAVGRPRAQASLDPSMEVFPDAPAKGRLEEGKDDTGA